MMPSGGMQKAHHTADEDLKDPKAPNDVKYLKFDWCDSDSNICSWERKLGCSRGVTGVNREKQVSKNATQEKTPESDQLPASQAPSTSSVITMQDFAFDEPTKTAFGAVAKIMCCML
jgi:hypothetical protein